MKKSILLIYLLSFVAILSAQNKNVLKVSKIDSTDQIALDKFWKFHDGDNTAWASSSFDDSKWDTINTNLAFDKNDSNVFKGIAWFRLHIYIDSALDDTPLALLVDQEGASQIFIDGKLIHTLGKVSANPNLEKKYTPGNIPLAFQYHTTGNHLLAIRYSNLNYLRLFKKYEAEKPGFTITVTKQDESVRHIFNEQILVTSVALIVGIFFITLGFVHLLIFLFYRKHRTNLYYSLFVFLFGFLFIIPAISKNLSSPELSILLNYYYLFLFPLFFYALLVLHYSLFRRPFGKYFVFSSFFLIVVLIFMLFKVNNFSLGALFSFIISTVVPSFFIVIKSIRRKTDGAWIIGTGSLLFLIFMGIVIINMLYGNGFNVSGLFPLILIFIALISIPISMSIYLAREFSRTNNNLENKLLEVESLSLKTIEQEKEKQKILETQKEILEVQVKERTFEIIEQKTIIERKNKDITDSIDYAKTIQEAILPDKDLKQQLFTDSFVLFKPKDIVSGDFYWFAEKNGKKIIAVCDCTGHGVPGALMSMIGNNILNQIVNEKGITSPAEILNNLHKEIRKTLKQEMQNETKDGMDAAIITFENETEIEFAGAQRPLWIIRKIDNEELTIDNGTSKQLTEIKGNKFAIGGLQSELERTFTNHKISLTKGNSIYISSDGFADQFSDIDKKLMTSRFKELLLSIQQKSMPEQELFLDDFIEKWRGKREQIDDILVIGIRI